MTPRQYVYPNESATEHEKKKFRKQERARRPEQLFVNQRKSTDDKYQFYTKDPEKWRNWIKEEFGDETEKIITYKYDTDKSTIMLHSDGECVIHVSNEKGGEFLTWFGEKVKINVKQEDQKTEDLNEKMKELTLKK